MEQDRDPPEFNQREGRAETLGGLLNTHLQRLSEARMQAMTEDERTQEPEPPKVVQLVPREPPPPRILCTPEQIIRELVLLDIVFPSQSLTPEERSLRYQVYCRDLGELTEQELVDACQAYRKNANARFFPTPGQILNEIPFIERILKNL